MRALAHSGSAVLVPEVPEWRALDLAPAFDTIVGLDRVSRAKPDPEVYLKAADLRKIAEGFDLEDGPVKVDEVSYIANAPKKEVGISIHSGKNRIVRRIFEHLGYEVAKLDRVVFAGLTKKDLPRGHWRHLSQHEINLLRMLS